MTVHDLILILHVLGAGVLIGVVVFSFALVIKKPLTADRVALLDKLVPFGKAAAGWQFLTGIYLAWHSWDDVKSLSIFWTKIILFIAAGLIIEFFIHRQAHKAVDQNDAQAASIVPIAATILVMVVIAIVTIGVLLVEHH